MKTINFKIKNLTCEACIKLSTTALKIIPGVENIQIDLQTGNSQISSKVEISWEQIESALRSVGKEAVNN